ncbi:hypothetical protein M3J07_002263 [Ascochyta lentis]
MLKVSHNVCLHYKLRYDINTGRHSRSSVPKSEHGKVRHA